MMNNYFHDVATALLVVSAVVVMFAARRAERHGSPEVMRYFVELYPKLARIAWFTVAWITLSGAVRLLTLRDFEWANAVRKDQISALTLKYVVMLIFIAAGFFLWTRVARKVKNLSV